MERKDLPPNTKELNLNPLSVQTERGFRLDGLARIGTCYSVYVIHTTEDTG